MTTGRQPARRAKRSRHAAHDLIAGTERVRRAAAERLHGLQSRIHAVRHRLAESRAALPSDPGRAVTAMDDAVRELDQICDGTIRGLTRDLYPLPIRITLLSALQAVADAHRPGLSITVRAERSVAALDSPLDNRIPESLRLAVYRTVETVLVRVAESTAGGTPRRTAPARIGVRLARDRNRLVVTISGTAASLRHATAPAAGELRARVSAAGGTLTWTKDHGTAASASFPLPG